MLCDWGGQLLASLGYFIKNYQSLIAGLFAVGAGLFVYHQTGVQRRIAREQHANKETAAILLVRAEVETVVRFVDGRACSMAKAISNGDETKLPSREFLVRSMTVPVTAGYRDSLRDFGTAASEDIADVVEFFYFAMNWNILLVMESDPRRIVKLGTDYFPKLSYLGRVAMAWLDQRLGKSPFEDVKTSKLLPSHVYAEAAIASNYDLEQAQALSGGSFPEETMTAYRKLKEEQAPPP